MGNTPWYRLDKHAVNLADGVNNELVKVRDAVLPEDSSLRKALVAAPKPSEAVAVVVNWSQKRIEAAIAVFDSSYVPSEYRETVGETTLRAQENYDRINGAGAFDRLPKKDKQKTVLGQVKTDGKEYDAAFKDLVEVAKVGEEMREYGEVVYAVFDNEYVMSKNRENTQQTKDRAKENYKWDNQDDPSKPAFESLSREEQNKIVMGQVKADGAAYLEKFKNVEKTMVTGAKMVANYVAPGVGGIIIDSAMTAADRNKILDAYPDGTRSADIGSANPAAYLIVNGTFQAASGDNEAAKKSFGEIKTENLVDLAFDIAGAKGGSKPKMINPKDLEKALASGGKKEVEKLVKDALAAGQKDIIKNVAGHELVKTVLHTQASKAIGGKIKEVAVSKLIDQGKKTLKKEGKDALVKEFPTLADMGIGDMDPKVQAQRLALEADPVLNEAFKKSGNKDLQNFLSSEAAVKAGFPSEVPTVEQSTQKLMERAEARKTYVDAQVALVAETTGKPATEADIKRITAEANGKTNAVLEKEGSEAQFVKAKIDTFVLDNNGKKPTKAEIEAFKTEAKGKSTEDLQSDVGELNDKQQMEVKKANYVKTKTEIEKIKNPNFNPKDNEGDKAKAATWVAEANQKNSAELDTANAALIVEKEKTVPPVILTQNGPTIVNPPVDKTVTNPTDKPVKPAPIVKPIVPDVVLKETQLDLQETRLEKLEKRIAKLEEKSGFKASMINGGLGNDYGIMGRSRAKEAELADRLAFVENGGKARDTGKVELLKAGPRRFTLEDRLNLDDRGPTAKTLLFKEGQEFDSRARTMEWNYERDGYKDRTEERLTDLEARVAAQEAKLGIGKEQPAPGKTVNNLPIEVETAQKEIEAIMKKATDPNDLSFKKDGLLDKAALKEALKKPRGVVNDYIAAELKKDPNNKAMQDMKKMSEATDQALDDGKPVKAPVQTAPVKQAPQFDGPMGGLMQLFSELLKMFGIDTEKLGLGTKQQGQGQGQGQGTGEQPVRPSRDTTERPVPPTNRVIEGRTPGRQSMPGTEDMNDMELDAFEHSILESEVKARVEKEAPRAIPEAKAQLVADEMQKIDAKATEAANGASSPEAAAAAKRAVITEALKDEQQKAATAKPVVKLVVPEKVQPSVVVPEEAVVRPKARPSAMGLTDENRKIFGLPERPTAKARPIVQAFGNLEATQPLVIKPAQVVADVSALKVDEPALNKALETLKVQVVADVAAQNPGKSDKDQETLVKQEMQKAQAMARQAQKNSRGTISAPAYIEAKTKALEVRNGANAGKDTKGLKENLKTAIEEQVAVEGFDPKLAEAEVQKRVGEIEKTAAEKPNAKDQNAVLKDAIETTQKATRDKAVSEYKQSVEAVAKANPLITDKAEFVNRVMKNDDLKTANPKVIAEATKKNIGKAAEITEKVTAKDAPALNEPEKKTGLGTPLLESGRGAETAVKENRASAGPDLAKAMAAADKLKDHLNKIGVSMPDASKNMAMTAEIGQLTAPTTGSKGAPSTEVGKQ